MKAEHCGTPGSQTRFETGSVKRTTWPANEWAITVLGEYKSSGPGCVGPSRKLQSIDQLMTEDLVVEAKLQRCEVIAVVLYTGPMVRWMYISIIHRNCGFFG
jgi:hypothetical protein